MLEAEVAAASEAASDAARRLERILRIDSAVVAVAVVVHVGAGGLVAWQARVGGAEDWWLYALMALTTAVMLTNYGRLGKHNSLIRRTLSGVATLLVVMAWAALLADRTTPTDGTLRVGVEASVLWTAVAMEAVVAALLVAHLFTLAPRLRAARDRARSGRRAVAMQREALQAASEHARRYDEQPAEKDVELAGAAATVSSAGGARADATAAGRGDAP